MIPRQAELADSIGLVLHNVSRSIPGILSRWTVNVSSRPSRRLAVAFGYRYSRLLAYYMMERYEEAISDLENYTSTYPENSDPWIYLALSFYNIEDYDSAITYFEKCINANIMLGESNYYLATICLNRQQFKKAVEHYTASADLDYQTDYSIYNRGVAYLNLNKKEQAKKDFQQVVKITKNTTLKKHAKDAISKLS
jgi:tetratricopeptide (TPR) repeat protein